MQETRKIAEEAKRAKKQHSKPGSPVRNFKRPHSGFESANRVYGDVNRSLQSVADEMTSYTRKSIEDVFKAWEQLANARSLPEVIDIQTRYAQKAMENYTSQSSRITELYLAGFARNASKPAQETGKQFQ